MPLRKTRKTNQFYFSKVNFLWLKKGYKAKTLKRLPWLFGNISNIFESSPRLQQVGIFLYICLGDLTHYALCTQMVSGISLFRSFFFVGVAHRQSSFPSGIFIDQVFMDKVQQQIISKWALNNVSAIYELIQVFVDLMQQLQHQNMFQYLVFESNQQNSHFFKIAINRQDTVRRCTFQMHHSRKC